MEQPAWTPTANEANKRLVLHVRLGCGSLSITTPVSHRCLKLIARASELGSCQSNLCNSWGYERLQKKSRGSLKDCFENVNIQQWINNNRTTALERKTATGWGRVGGLKHQKFVLDSVVVVKAHMLSSQWRFLTITERQSNHINTLWWNKENGSRLADSQS